MTTSLDNASQANWPGQGYIYRGLGIHHHNAKEQTGREGGRESVAHQSPQSNPRTCLFKTTYNLTTTVPQVTLHYWTYSVASFHRVI